MGNETELVASACKASRTLKCHLRKELIRRIQLVDSQSSSEQAIQHMWSKHRNWAVAKIQPQWGSSNIWPTVNYKTWLLDSDVFALKILRHSLFWESLLIITFCIVCSPWLSYRTLERKLTEENTLEHSKFLVVTQHLYHCILAHLATIGQCTQVKGCFAVPYL